MNTIPTIFNERKVPHTIVGGKVKKSDEDRSPFTVILLNRGGRYYRSAVFQSLESAGFASVISIAAIGAFLLLGQQTNSQFRTVETEYAKVN